MVNIHLLAAEQPSDLLLCIKDYTEHKDTPAENSDNKGNLRLGYGKYANTEFYQSQYIYITNDEKPKDGDYYFDNLVHFDLIDYPLKHSGVEYENGNMPNIIQSTTGTTSPIRTSSKIILTTDPKLIADGVQSIPDDFLEWFVKNPTCEFVKTIYGLFNPMGRQVDPMNLGQNHSQCVWKYKIIIPSEEIYFDFTGELDVKINKPIDVQGGEDIKSPASTVIIVGPGMPLTKLTAVKNIKTHMVNESYKSYPDYNFKQPIQEEKRKVFMEGVDETLKVVDRVMYSEQEVLPIIEYIQWVVRKIDAGDTPEETVRLLLFERDKIELFKKK